MTLVQSPTYSPLMINATHDIAAAEEIQQALRSDSSLGFYVHWRAKTIAFVLVEKTGDADYCIARLCFGKGYAGQGHVKELLEILVDTLQKVYIADKITFGDKLER